MFLNINFYKVEVMFVSMKLKLDENFEEFVYDSEGGQFVNATKNRVAGLNKIIGNSSRKSAGLPYAVAFNEETKAGYIVKGFNGGRFLVNGSEGEIISDLVLGSYYSRQREMLGFEEDAVRIKGKDGETRKYVFPN